jgi:putative ABC transport system substrate-binding protein
VNTQVARSLGISLDDEASLNNKLKRTSEVEP